MAPSMPSSPSSNASAPGTPLTPRSKIRALLATVQSSDEDEGSPNAAPPLSADDTDTPARPRGRLASRMVATAAPKPVEDGVGVLQQRATVQPSSPNRSAASDFHGSPPLTSAGRTHVDWESNSDIQPAKARRSKQSIKKKVRPCSPNRAAASGWFKQVGQGSQSDSGADPFGPSTRRGQRTGRAKKQADEGLTRETQRIVRSMQLAHEALTRTKITKTSLFEAFNYNPLQAASAMTATAMTVTAMATPKPSSSSSRPPTPTSLRYAGHGSRPSDTPPSSPPLSRLPAQDLAGANKAHVELPAAECLEHDDQSLAITPHDAKGKGKALDTRSAQPECLEPGMMAKLASSDLVAVPPRKRIRVKFPALAEAVSLGTDDDGLEIVVKPKTRLDALFDSVPLQQDKLPRPLQALRRLALAKPTNQTGISRAELQVRLAGQVQEQAKRERISRIEGLRARGVEVQTAQEWMEQLQSVEDIVARARDEAEAVKRRERKLAKKPDDASKAARLVVDDDDHGSEADISGSEQDDDFEMNDAVGSEDEDEEEDSGEEEEGDQEGERENAQKGLTLVDDEAEEGVESDDSAEGQRPLLIDGVSQLTGEPPSTTVGRRHKVIVVSSEDEDDDGSDDEEQLTATPQVPVAATPSLRETVRTIHSSQNLDSPAVPMVVLRSAKKTFIPGLPVAGPAVLGLTQIFAGTVDSQAAPAAGLDGSYATPLEMPDFDAFPDPSKSDDDQEDVGLDADDDMVVQDSQPLDPSRETQDAVQLSFTQSQTCGLDSLAQQDFFPVTQPLDLMELTQDAGLQCYTPLNQRFVEPPPSTAPTVLNDGLDESPLVGRRGRLMRKADLQAPSKDEGLDEFGFDTVAHKAGPEGQKTQPGQEMSQFDRKKSKARGMVDDQAEESEDEYAGMGGVDKEDGSDDDEGDDHSVADMIDDEGQDDVDEAAMAAFYAHRERAQDEKEVEKLFRNLNSGMLRRKRGAEYSLSDSDDDGGAARQQMKRRQFAKMQRALFADERIKKFAERAGNQAFLRTIEDRASDDEDSGMAFADVLGHDSHHSADEDVDRTVATVPDSQPLPSITVATTNPRRTATIRKRPVPSAVRATLSSLLDEPGPELPGVDTVVESDDDDKENQSPNRRREAVVDRISLKRVPSGLSGSRPAFATAATTAITSSRARAPALLRRATTNSSLFSNASAPKSVPGSERAGGFGDEVKIKTTAGRRSGVSRLLTRGRAPGEGGGASAAAEARERRREERRIQEARGRMAEVGELFGSGRFG